MSNAKVEQEKVEELLKDLDYNLKGSGGVNCIGIPAELVK